MAVDGLEWIGLSLEGACLIPYVVSVLHPERHMGRAKLALTLWIVGRKPGGLVGGGVELRLKEVVFEGHFLDTLARPVGDERLALMI